MDKTYNHKTTESDIYKMWEDGGYFKPLETATGAPFSIVMPPPNANGELHLGHATFVAVSDALVRYHRMKGDPTLWLPGVDHAGILTQVTFEKKLKKEENTTRHALGRAEFHRRCYDFCMWSKEKMEEQLRALGASCDWSREKFTLDPEISKMVLETFVRMYGEGLVYRGYRIVNWCPRCTTTLADLETVDKEQTDKLYYLDYGTVTIATVRPETIFADVAVAVNPADKRYKSLIGKSAVVPLINKSVPVIADDAVETEFGTGALKVTPGHDITDYEIGQRHALSVVSVIDFDGRMTGNIPAELAGLYVTAARAKTVDMLKAAGKLVKTEEYAHNVKTCERCATVIEPLISRQWFVKIASLAKPAIKAVEDGRVVIIPKKYEHMYFAWMNQIRDWPISRQLWWGHRLPVWYCAGCQTSSEQQREFELLAQNDTRAKTDILDDPIVSIERPVKCPKCSGSNLVQDPDTFDAWFSSGQWPVTTLKTSGTGDFEKFYPTSVMNTAYEILFLWVARMIMFGLYLTGDVPFKVALINGVLRDDTGKKMSKSLGNGVNPNEAIDQYGADAVRMALVAGRDNGNDLMISKGQMEERIRGYRNFSNKLWNVTRFVTMAGEAGTGGGDGKNVDDARILDELKITVAKVTDYMEAYRLGEASQELYDFVWHKFADVYIEKVKDRRGDAAPVLRQVLTTSLRLLHPFMPFVTEALWQELGEPGPLIVAEWPR